MWWVKIYLTFPTFHALLKIFISLISTYSTRIDKFILKCHRYCKITNTWKITNFWKEDRFHIVSDLIIIFSSYYYIVSLRRLKIYMAYFVVSLLPRIGRWTIMHTTVLETSSMSSSAFWQIFFNFSYNHIVSLLSCGVGIQLSIV